MQATFSNPLTEERPKELVLTEGAQRCRVDHGGSSSYFWAELKGLGMFRFRRCAILGSALLVGTAASATEPFYFHKPHIERDRFIADYMECEGLADGVHQPRHNSYSPDIYAMAANSFFAGFMNSRERRGNIENVLRTCMADKGYRRVEASRSTRMELNKLSPEARIERLFALAASPEPEGRVLPR